MLQKLQRPTVPRFTETTKTAILDSGIYDEVCICCNIMTGHVSNIMQNPSTLFTLACVKQSVHDSVCIHVVLVSVRIAP